MSLGAPLRVYLDTTYWCNLQCTHCITSSGPKIPTTSNLTLIELRALFAELKSMGTTSIAMGGGEPLAHPNLGEILQSAQDHHFSIVLTTNGTLLTREIAAQLSACGVKTVKVSIDGNQQHHDALRGNGSFAKTIAGIRASREFLPNIGLRMTVIKETIVDVPAVAVLAQNLSCDMLKIAAIKPFGRAVTQPELLLRETDVRQLLQMVDVAKRMVQLPIYVSTEDTRGIADSIQDDKPRSGSAMDCGAGTESCYIDPKGNVYPCVTLPNFPAGNIRQSSFRQIWEESPLFNALRHRTSCESCLLCETQGQFPLVHIETTVAPSTSPVTGDPKSVCS